MNKLALAMQAGANFINKAHMKAPGTFHTNQGDITFEQAYIVLCLLAEKVTDNGLSKEDMDEVLDDLHKFKIEG